MKRLEWYIARRYLSSRRKGQFLSLITLIAVGGITLGVTALLTVISVMTGLQQDLQRLILGANPHVYVFEQQAQGFRLGDADRLTARVRDVPGVVAAEPFIMTQVVLLPQGSQYAQFGQLFGIAPSAAGPPMTQIHQEIRDGRKAFGPTESGLPGVLIGSKLASKLGVLPGDVVQVIAGENVKETPTGLVPVIREFEVTGTFETGMYEYDNQNLYAPMAAAQDLLSLPPDTVSGIAVNVTDPWLAAETGTEIGSVLGFPYYTQDWMSLNSSLFSALKLEKLAMGIILSLIILVAAFNIISTLIMVVRDKTREIGILKSMGLTDRMVLRIFMLQGLAIGVIGTTLGTLGGLGLIGLLARYKFIELPGDVYFIDRLPVALDPRDLLMIVGVSLLIAFVATIYPARQASRLLPVEAIRHD